jgi:hypothetical protein
MKPFMVCMKNLNISLRCSIIWKRKRRHSVEAFNYVLISEANERPSDAVGGTDVPRPTVTRGRYNG